MKSMAFMCALAFTSLTSTVYADDAVPRKPKNSPTPEFKIETLRLGKMIVIGPDGKMETRDFGDEVPADVLKNLPKEVRDQIEKIVQPKVDSRPKVPARGALAGSVRIIMEKDGKLLKIEADNVQINMEKDGKPLKIEADLSGVDVLKQLEKAIGDAGDNLPADPQKILKAAMQALGGTTPTGQTPARQADEISRKLDQILDRMERLEKELRQLKATR